MPTKPKPKAENDFEALAEEIEEQRFAVKRFLYRLEKELAEGVTSKRAFEIGISMDLRMGQLRILEKLLVRARDLRFKASRARIDKECDHAAAL